MEKTPSVLTTIILIVMLLSVIAPAAKVAALTDSTTPSSHKTLDIFGGSFTPQEVVAASDKTFSVAFSLLPTMDIPDTAISFVLPADLVKLASGSQVWTGDLKKGEASTLTLSLEANGEVEAYVRADVAASLSGQNYQSSYYLHVATSGAGFNPNPASVSMEHGFLRSANLQYVSTAPSTESSRAQENPQAPQSTSGTFEVKGRFQYLDENGGYSSARYMSVRLRDNNDAGWSVTAWTNATGYFDFIVANSASGRSPIVDLIAEGTWDWKGTDSNGAQYWWSTGVLATNVADGWVWTNYGLSPGNNNDILQAGDAVYAETQMIYDWTGWMRSKVTIRWPQETWPHSHGDFIDLPLKSTAGWDHVTVQHEEGHCVMWALYGAWPPGTEPNPHYIYSESSQGFAFMEGWAEFMMCAVDNNPNNCVAWYNGHGGNMETNDWFNCQTSGNMDGAIVEGSIASILWDIFDPVDIAGDKDYMASGFTQIFTVMQNDKPQNMLDFWNDWTTRWSDNSTSKGPLCTIYYQYGIDEDWFNPWGSVIINAGDTYTPSRTVTLTLDGEDWGAGVQYMRLSEDYGVTWGGWYNYATTFSYDITSPGDGWKYIDVQYADYWWLSNAGTIYDGIGLDTTPPTGTILVANGSAYTTSRTVTLNLTATDNYSGVSLMRFSENMGTWSSWVPFATTYAYTLTTPNDGTKSVDVQFQDYAGQNSTMWGIWDYIFLDTTKPTGTVLINNGSIATSSTSVYLNLTYTDAGSGVHQIRFGNTGDPWSAWEAPSPTRAWTLPAGDGTKYVWCEVMDNAGLISDQFYDGIFLDTTNPNGSIVVGSGNPTYTTSASVTLYLTYYDATSGVYQVRYGNSGGSWSAWEAPAATKAWTLTAGDGSKTVWYQVMDYAGLTSTQYSDSIILDTTAPTGSIIINGGATTTPTRSVTLSLTYSDATSGVYQVRYGNTGEPWSAWEAPSATKAWTLTAGAGTKTVWYQIIDNAGLVSTMYSDDIILQTQDLAFLVVRGSDNRIYYRVYNSTTASWYGWNSLPTGTTLDSPAAAYADKLYFVVRGSNGNTLWFSSVNLTDSNFSGWTLLSGSTPSIPILTSNGTTLSLVVRGNDDRIYYRFYTIATQTWTGWSALPSGTTLDTPAASLVGNTLHIVVRGSDGNTLWYSNLNQTNQTFSGWALLGGSTPSIPTLASNGTSLALVVRGGDNRIYYRAYTIATLTWTGWSALPSGTTQDSPAATILGNTLYIAVRGSDGSSLWQSSVNLGTSTFSGWTLPSGSTPSKPTLTS